MLLLQGACFINALAISGKLTKYLLAEARLLSPNVVDLLYEKVLDYSQLRVRRQ